MPLAEKFAEKDISSPLLLSLRPRLSHYGKTGRRWSEARRG